MDKHHLLISGKQPNSRHNECLITTIPVNLSTLFTREQLHVDDDTISLAIYTPKRYTRKEAALCNIIGTLTIGTFSSWVCKHINEESLCWR